jgi:hypothetical protein
MSDKMRSVAIRIHEDSDMMMPKPVEAHRWQLLALQQRICSHRLGALSAPEQSSISPNSSP